MKGRFRSFLVAVAVVVAGFYWWTPGHTLRALTSSIEARDAVELEDRVDFSTLRDGLKAQLNSVVLDRADIDPGEVGDDPLVAGLQALGTSLAMMLVDGMIDAFVTPAGLAELSRGMVPGSGRGSGGEDEETFSEARIDRETPARFSAWVPARAPGGDVEVRFVFRRYGLRWRLTNIILPDDLWPTIP